MDFLVVGIALLAIVIVFMGTLIVVAHFGSKVPTNEQIITDARRQAKPSSKAL